MQGKNDANTLKNNISWDSIKKNIHDVFTWDYYKNGFSGWTLQSRVWWVIGLFVIILTGLMQPVIDWRTILSIIGGSIGFTTTLAITNNKRINGVLGLISATIISYLSIHAGNPADAFLQIVFLFAFDLPVILFGDLWNKTKIKPRLGKNGYIIMISVFFIGTALMYFMDSKILHTRRPLIDSLASSTGFVGAAMMVGKYSNQYIWWAIQGLMSVILWGITASQGDANWVLFATYMIYFGNNILGLFFSPWAYRNNKDKK